MNHPAARQIGEELKASLDHLKAIAKEERVKHGADVEAIEIAIVHLDSAIEILTE